MYIKNYKYRDIFKDNKAKKEVTEEEKEDMRKMLEDWQKGGKQLASTETLQVKIIADASSLSKELSNVSTQLRNTEDSLEGLTNVGKGMQQVGKVVTAVGVAITGAIGAIVMKGSEWQESVNRPE